MNPPQERLQIFQPQTCRLEATSGSPPSPLLLDSHVLVKVAAAAVAVRLLPPAVLIAGGWDGGDGGAWG